MWIENKPHSFVTPRGPARSERDHMRGGAAFSESDLARSRSLAVTESRATLEPPARPFSLLTRTAAYAGQMQVHPGGGLRKTLKFLIAVLLHPAVYRRWYDYLDNDLPQGTDGSLVLSLVRRPSIPYLRRWLTTREKSELLARHYRMFDGCLSASALRSMNENGVVLAELTGRSGHRYQILLCRAAARGGEICTRFVDATRNVALAQLCGSFGSDRDGRVVFWIGDLIGAKPPFGRREIAAATRDLYSLRPKQALVHAVCALCAWADVGAIQAPSVQNHFAHRWWRRWLTKRKIHADYDGFWREFTSERDAKGDFRIAVPLHRRSLESVPSKRRSNWAKRYAQVDAMEKSAVAVLAALRRA